MENANDRKQHLQNLLTLLEECSTFIDSNFTILYNQLQEEVARETKRLNDRKKNPYLHNLKTTLEKQVADYTEAIPDFKHAEYFRFIKSFKEDVKDELERIVKFG